MRALVASVLREVEAATSMDPADRARLLLYGAQVLTKVIETCETQAKWERVAKQVRELLEDRERRAAEAKPGRMP